MNNLDGRKITKLSKINQIDLGGVCSTASGRQFFVLVARDIGLKRSEI